MHYQSKSIVRGMVTSEANGESFLKQLSHGGEGGGGSRRWTKKKSFPTNGNNGDQYFGTTTSVNGKKRVMVVVDKSTNAMMWALTHIANRGDLLTLLHVIPPHHHSPPSTLPLASSLASLCKACKPEVEVEALVIQGPKLATVLSQVKKLEAAVLVLSQTKPSPFSCLFGSSSEKFVEECINRSECLTLAVRKQSKGIGGYLVSTRWHKNFWLLA